MTGAKVERAASCKGVVFAALVVAVVSSASGCRARDCDNDTAPEGTRFQVEVLEELPDSNRCHLFKVEPGDSFFLTAGPTVEVGGGEDSHSCLSTEVAGPPEGVATDFEYAGGCYSGGGLTGECDIQFSEVCPGLEDAGYVHFYFRGSEHPGPPRGLLDAIPSVVTFEILTSVRKECWQNSPDPSCTDKYRVRISRLVQE